MDAAVVLFLDEVRVRSEGVLVAVLEDEIAARMKDVVLENLVRNILQTFQGVGRVGEDDVELLTATLQKAEHVTADENVVVGFYLFHALTDEGGMVAVAFNAHYLLAAA